MVSLFCNVPFVFKICQNQWEDVMLSCLVLEFGGQQFLHGRTSLSSFFASFSLQPRYQQARNHQATSKELHVPIFPVPSFLAADAFLFSFQRTGCLDATLTGALQTGRGEFCKMDGLDSATGKLRLGWNETKHDKTEELKHTESIISLVRSSQFENK